MKYLDKILNSQKTVFSYGDISTIICIENKNTIKSFIFRLLKNGIIKSNFKGIYTLNKYNIFEFASKLKKIHIFLLKLF